jgi:aspartate/methionine/tyrosine aminotransferase
MADTFIPFDLERNMSRWEQVVEYNLSESGVHPLLVRELLKDPNLEEDLLATPLNYPHADGLPILRERIASLYPGATAENVLVTTGAAQANYCSTHTVLGPGDQLAYMLPNYMQIWGVAQNLGATVNTFSLKEELDWAVDLEALERAISPQTKLIAVCNPNNPSGHIMSDEEMDAVVAAADRAGAWLLADEVYAGAERVREQITPTFYGRYNKVLAVGSMSKAYGLPGLRIGWVVAPPEMIQAIWARQDYVTICASMLANKLAAHALKPDVLARLMQRTRAYIRKGYAVFERWWEEHGEIFSLVPPQAAAIAFVRYNIDVNSSALIDRLVREKSTYVVPGDHFGIDHHIRISYGLPEPYLQEGLDRIYDLIASYT